jgi:hypothetical protein
VGLKAGFLKLPASKRASLTVHSTYRAQASASPAVSARTSGVHPPLTRFGLSTFCHLCRHCTSVRPGR